MKEYKFIGKVIKTGNSSAVTIPPAVLDLLKLKAGDYAELSIKKVK